MGRGRKVCDVRADETGGASDADRHNFPASALFERSYTAQPTVTQCRPASSPPDSRRPGAAAARRHGGGVRVRPRRGDRPLPPRHRRTRGALERGRARPPRPSSRAARPSSRSRTAPRCAHAGRAAAPPERGLRRAELRRARRRSSSRTTPTSRVSGTSTAVRDRHARGLGARRGRRRARRPRRDRRRARQRRRLRELRRLPARARPAAARRSSTPGTSSAATPTPTTATGTARTWPARSPRPPTTAWRAAGVAYGVEDHAAEGARRLRRGQLRSRSPRRSATPPATAPT